MKVKIRGGMMHGQWLDVPDSLPPFWKVCLPLPDGVFHRSKLAMSRTEPMQIRQFRLEAFQGPGGWRVLRYVPIWMTIHDMCCRRPWLLPEPEGSLV